MFCCDGVTGEFTTFPPSHFQVGSSKYFNSSFKQAHHTAHILKKAGGLCSQKWVQHLIINITLYKKQFSRLSATVPYSHLFWQSYFYSLRCRDNFSNQEEYFCLFIKLIQTRLTSEIILRNTETLLVDNLLKREFFLGKPKRHQQITYLKGNIVQENRNFTSR